MDREDDTWKKGIEVMEMERRKLDSCKRGTQREIKVVGE